MKKLTLGTKIRPLSWSAISSFEYDKEQWYRKYVLNEATPSNPAMEAGKRIGERIASDLSYLPELPRLKQYEKKLEGKIGNIVLIGYLDMFDPETKNFDEIKTSANKKKWSQKSSDTHGQLDMYYLLLWLNYEVQPEKIRSRLHYIPVEETATFEIDIITPISIQTFEVKKTTKDILKFGAYLQKTYKDMIEYTEEHP